MYIPCGREVRCEPCVGLSAEDAKTVCITVEGLVGSLATGNELEDIALEGLNFWVDDDDYVTPGMHTATVLSLEQINKLIK